MCGIVGILDLNGRREIARSLLARMNETQHHRGPDAGGLHLDMGDMRLSRTLDFVDAEGDVDLALRGQSIGAHLALFGQAYRDQHNQVDVGLTYKSRSTMDLSGEADFTSPDAFSMKTADQAYTQKEQSMGDTTMRSLEKMILLTTIDHLWKDHLLAMDHLREGIGGRDGVRSRALSGSARRRR